MRLQHIKVLTRILKNRDFKSFSNLLVKGAITPLLPLFKQIKKGPVISTFIATYRCNLRCRFCGLYEKANLNDELPYDEIIKIIDHLKVLDVNAVGLTGGEPLLRNDILDIIEYIKKGGIHVHLNTNGILITPEIALKLCKIPVETINISLDGYHAEVHDALRAKPGAFKKAVNGARNVIEAKKKLNAATKLSFVSVLAPENMRDVKKIHEFSMKTKVDSLSFLPEHKFSGGKFEVSHDILNECVESLLELKNEFKHIDNSTHYIKLFHRHFQNKHNNLKCFAPFQSFNFDCYGNIFACVPFSEKWIVEGSLKETTVQDFWYSGKYQQRRKELLKCGGCYWNCHTEMNLYYRFL